MIVVAIRVLVPLNICRELVQTLRSLLNSIQNQKGCLSSHFYFEVGDENTLCLIAEWESQADSNNHPKSYDFTVLPRAVNLLKGPSEIDFKLLAPTAGIEAAEMARGKIGTRAPIQ